MPIPLEQTMCWDKSSQKNSANTPVLMMAAIARLTGSNPSLACVPLFGDGVSCGFPSPAQDYVEKRLSLDDLCIRYPESTYLVRAEGDSMLNAGIKDGDLLIVECIREAKHGDIVIEAVYFLEVHQARNSSRRGNKIPFRRRIDSSKPTCRQNRCCKNGSDHRFRFPNGAL